MNIIPLGTAGFIPTSGKETSSIVIIADDTAILLDAGTGVKRLNEDKIKNELNNVKSMHVLFSHFHHDHTAGFTWLLRLWDRPLSVYLPTIKNYNLDGIAAITNYTKLPYFGLELSKWPQCSNIVSINSDQFNCGNLKIQVISQSHSGGSLGFRIGDFAYITDTEPREPHISFLQDCNLVFMDTMHDDDDFKMLNSSPDKPADHGSSIVNSKIAIAANISRLGLIHVDPLYSSRRIDKMLTEAINFAKSHNSDCDIFIPKEGEIYHAI